MRAAKWALSAAACTGRVVEGDLTENSEDNYEINSDAAGAARLPRGRGASQLPAAVAADGRAAAPGLLARKGRIPPLIDREAGPLGTRPFFSYDAKAIKAHYDRNPLPVLARVISVGTPLLVWATQAVLPRACCAPGAAACHHAPQCSGLS